MRAFLHEFGEVLEELRLMFGLFLVAQTVVVIMETVHTRVGRIA